MRIGTDHFKKILSFILFCLVLFYLPVMAQDEEIVSNGPITKVDLGVDSLNLAVGESYTFQVTFEPENTDLTTLDWYITDESVISIDPLTDTVTALAEGEARIFAESFDQASYDICTVTVGTSVSKDASVMKSGSDFIGLSPEELGKISAETLTRYLNFVADSALDDAAYVNSISRLFDVVAAVKPGTEDAQSRLARDCGVEDSEPLYEMNAVTLYGSLESILRYVKGNNELREIFEFGPFYIDDPEMDEVSSDSIQKAVGLQGNTQAITNISYAHKMGLNGKGRWIAVIDSGINRSNAQFTNGGRQIIEACFSKAKNYKSYTVRSVCKDGVKNVQGASAAVNARKKTLFNHGSHVTGIAAGRDGIAPLANIISIQSHTEKVWNCNAKERQQYSCGNKSTQCCKTYISDSDLARSYEYVLELSKTRKIDAVNMSYGNNSTQYKSVCDSKNKFEKNYFDKMRNAGMLPVVSSGNDKWNGAVGSPACLSNAYTVGNVTLSNNTIMLAKSSNHSKKVDITAPGVNIRSAGYTTPMMNMSGTSMAAPMVTGAVALVKQMYPGMTVDDTGDYLKSISQKTVKSRMGGFTFNYSKPVLTFGLIHKLTVPYFNWTTGGNNSITFKVYRMAKNNVKFSAEVTKLNGEKITGIKVQTKSQGDFTYVRLSGTNLENGKIYKVKLKRTFSVGRVNYWSTATNYGRPWNGTKTPNVTVKDKGVSLTAENGGVRYTIYDGVTGAIVRQKNVTNGTVKTDFSGLVNGRLYYVTAASYQTINITKDGAKKAVNFYGTESGRQSFMPMSAPFNARVSYPAVKNPTSMTVSCSADKGATGIIVKYRSGSSGAWTDGCTSEPGHFSCKVNVGRGHDIQVMKYRTLNGNRIIGPAAIIKGKK